MALTDDHLSTSAVWEALVLSPNDSDVNGALSLIGREPSPTLVGPATVCLAIRFAGEEEYGRPTDRAKCALPLATRLVEQHAAAVLTPRLLELIKADTEDYVWHKAVSDPALASIVGAIAAALRQPVLDVKDKVISRGVHYHHFYDSQRLPMSPNDSRLLQPFPTPAVCVSRCLPVSPSVSHILPTTPDV